MSDSLWPHGHSPSDSSVHGIFQARILKWVAISYSRGSSRRRDWICVSCISCTARWILYHWATREASTNHLDFFCLFPCPWGGVCVCVCVCVCACVCLVLSCFQFFVAPENVDHQAWNFPGRNTGVGYHFLHQGIFLIHWDKESSPLLKLNSSMNPLMELIVIYYER